ncbi:ImmA/IrrE family metallo-endopeptidase [Sporomusa aerivorans]|uniref:ImmA/IrrE family metallo-endopeptidase n=1 Tax=Sporomusa aerivorans TaxID=204936 RepID=UPI003529DDA1
MLWNDDGRFIIVVNPDLPKARRLFTVAHELGHFLMHRFYQPTFFCTRLKGQVDQKER